MADKLQIFICEHFKADTEAVLNSGTFKDVSVSYFPSRCGRPISANNRLESLSLFKPTDKDRLFCACSCLSVSDKTFLYEKNIHKLHLNNCFEMFAPKAFVDQLTLSGAYICTPDWLHKWERWVKNWGDQAQARQMFSESVSRIVFLDTGIDINSKHDLKAFAEYIDRPSETIAVGLDHYKCYLENNVLKWRIKQKDILLNSPSKIQKSNDSEYAMALALMGELSQAKNEEEVAREIIEISKMLFGAQRVNYLAINDGHIIDLWSTEAETEKESIIANLNKLDEDIKLNSSKKGFCMSIKKGYQTFAILEIEDISFPNNIVRYQNIALAMNDVLALSIENTRHLHTIVEMNNSLKASNSTKDRLFSIIAHDLRSPFNGILGFLNLLSKSNTQSDIDSLRGLSTFVHSSVKNTLVLLENLLSWAKSQSDNLKVVPEKINISELLAEVAEYSLISANTKHISIKYDETIVATIISDKNILKTILQNLISNSIKFTDTEGEIFLSFSKSDNSFEFSVRDNGIGMSEEDREKLFNISTNTSKVGTNNEKGSGLGLVLCKELTEMLGGEIWVETELNVGSCFKFRIPVNV